VKEAKEKRKLATSPDFDSYSKLSGPSREQIEADFHPSGRPLGTVTVLSLMLASGIP
jgi:hypothetical protein